MKILKKYLNNLINYFSENPIKISERKNNNKRWLYFLLQALKRLRR